MRNDLPSGTVTFLFTDVEGSTRLLHELGSEKYADALAEHRRLIREACAAEGGVEVDTQGDAFFFSFPSAQRGLAAAESMTGALASGPIQVRIGLHTGTPLLTEEGYVGDDVHFGARVAASSHGGQIVLSAATAELVEVQLTDLGEHRLKDIAEAVPIFQLGEGSFPPLKTISNTNLPRPASSFVGREAELREVRSRIEQGARLVTLSGPGGSGKTRLALEAASTLVPEYKAGIFWVGLAALRDSALVAETIAQILGAKDGLAEHIGEREMLLLLDNLEQVIEAAPELSGLLQACPNLTLLVTSRELLRVQGEVEYPVPPLASPEAVSLFCERSQLEPSEEIVELCARLDNLPLAVELAAARAKALSPAQILERLSQRLDLLKGGRDADPRQQTLRATIEWSYDLLSPEEQALFARLSVFQGGCTLEAAEDVAEADLDTLQSLVEKSLLRFTNERYWMLETIREFAGERIRESGDAETMRRQTEYFVTLVRRLGGDQAWTAPDGRVVEELGIEQANLRILLERLGHLGESSLMLEVASALAPYWFLRGRFHEGRGWFEAALALPDTHVSAVRGEALSNAADLMRACGDTGRARLLASESLEIWEKLGDARGMGRALHDLGEIAAQEEKFDHAKALYEKAIFYAHEAGHPAGGSISNLADIALAEGDYARARELSIRAGEIFRASGNRAGYSVSLFNLACASLHEGAHADASSYLRQAVQLCLELHYTEGAAWCFQACAAILARRDMPREAACFLGAGAALLEEMGTTLEPAERRMHEETHELVRIKLPAEEFAAAWESGKRLLLDDALALALEALD